MSGTAEEIWHRDFYDDVFAAQCLRRNADEIQKTVAFLMQKLQLDSGMTFFDQGCGIGQISLALARQGVSVIGIDLIETYIAEAEKQARAENLPCTFYTGNAYEFVPPAACDAAINWWTSFGYSEDDNKNILMMKRVFEALKPGGRFGFEYKNGERLLKDFAQTNTLCDISERDGHHTVWESRYDPESNMVYKNWIYTAPDGTRHIKKGGGAKLYTANDIKRLLKEAGFTPPVFYGDIDGREFDPETAQRCIAVAAKPEDV